jgi:hypothetical protein
MQQLRVLKLLARAAAASQQCSVQDQLPLAEGLAGTPGQGDEASDEGPAEPVAQVPQVQLGPEGEFACSVVHSTLPEGHPGVRRKFQGSS